MSRKLEVAEYVDGYRIKLTFSDGRCGEVDLELHLWGEVFGPLKDVALY